MTVRPPRDDAQAARSERLPRKTYDAPKLRVYGDVSALTLAIGNTSHKSDGGSMSTSKTA
jgi:hypothetical protein